MGVIREAHIVVSLGIHRESLPGTPERNQNLQMFKSYMPQTR
jgi:hypothetical protein